MKPLFSRWQIAGLASLLAVLLGAAIFVLAGPGAPHDGAAGTATKFANHLPVGGDFTLDSADGPLPLTRFRGQVVVVYFGYASCPDACPTTLGATAQALAQLSTAELAKIQPIFISVDPERDRPPALKEYAAFFHPKIIGATATTDKLAELARRYEVYYHRQESGSATGYTVDHSSSLYIIDSHGKLVTILPHGASPTQIAAALRHALPS